MLFNTRLDPKDIETQGLDTLTLTTDQRSRSRFLAMTDAGVSVQIDLPRTQHLRPGDVIEAKDGTRLVICAKKEPLIRLVSDNALILLQCAYHLGNRHTPVMVTQDALYFAPDAVLVEMVELLGGQCEAISMGFEPESGAYGAVAGHGFAKTHHHTHD